MSVPHGLDALGRLRKSQFDTDRLRAKRYCCSRLAMERVPERHSRLDRNNSIPVPYMAEEMKAMSRQPYSTLCHVGWAQEKLSPS